MTQVLVVDDSSSIRQLAGFTLKSGGYECEEAADGVEALALSQKSSFDLIVTDLNMPNMGGLELTAELRKVSAYAGTPILVLTTETDAEKKTAGKQAGVTGWIVKPFNPEALLKTVARFVSP